MCSISFDHVPKTAGTAIELAARRVGYEWLRVPRTLAVNDSGLAWLCRNVAAASYGYPCCNGWHVPGSMLTRPAARWRFCVIRDPLARLASEFSQQHHGYGAAAVCTMAPVPRGVFVEWLHRKKAALTRSRYTSDCHFLPQSESYCRDDGRFCMSNSIYTRHVKRHGTKYCGAHNGTKHCEARRSSQAASIGEVKLGLILDMRIPRL